jgi:hypothetical protein
MLLLTMFRVLWVAAGPSQAASMVSRMSHASRHSAVSRAAQAAISSEPQPSNMSALNLSISQAPGVRKESNSSPASKTAAAAAADGLPAKPGCTSLSLNEILTACRQAKAAAQANARIKPATFVLPAGGPDEEAAPEQRMPQGKGRPQAGDGSDSFARKQVSRHWVGVMSSLQQHIYAAWHGSQAVKGSWNMQLSLSHDGGLCRAMLS